MWLELDESTKQTNELDEVSFLEKEQRKLHPSEKQLTMPRQWSLKAHSESSRPVALNGGDFAPRGEIWQCLETLSVVTSGGGDAPGN